MLAARRRCANLLPAVIYSGEPRWTAPGGMASVGLSAAGDPLLPPSSYLLLDAQRLAEDDVPERNIVSAVFKATAAKFPQDLSSLASLWAWLPDEVDTTRCRAVMEVIADWVLIATGKSPDSDEGLDLRRMLLNEETAMHGLEQRLKQQREGWRQEGREEGIEQGLARGMEQGLAQAHNQWAAWNRRRVTAERQGRDFKEPPPGS